MSVKIKLGIMLFNLLTFSIYFYQMDVQSKTLKIIILLLIVISLIGIVTVKSSSKLIRVYHDLQFSLLIIVLLFCIIELLRFFPSVLPLQIRNYLQTENTDDIRKTVVEYLNESPYVKFKPNTIIKSQGYRGTIEQFVYEWKSDINGFKNLDSVTYDNNVDIVSLGDSFTEGMGVATRDTWSSLLTGYGYITYNLGVQGYAPTQMEGVFRLYGLKLKPKYVIIGYSSTTYDRETSFFDINETIGKKKFTGGISSIVEREIRNQTKQVTTAIYLLLKNQLGNQIREKRWIYTQNRDRDKSRLLNKYNTEVARVDSKKFDNSSVESSKEWQKTLRAFSNIKKMAEGIGAKTVLLYFPDRGHMYYEKINGKKLPTDNYEKKESQLLKIYAEKERIAYIDPSAIIIQYVNSIKNNADIRLYPYLELDGHLSPVGHKLIADEVSYLLKSRRYSP